MRLTKIKQRTLPYSQEPFKNDVSERIQQQIRYYSKRPEKIAGRLKALDKEWDIERALQADASNLFMVSNTLGFLCDRKFFLVSTPIGSLLLQHALQGCPPSLTLLKQAGLRTAEEIQAERYALQRIRQTLH